MVCKPRETHDASRLRAGDHGGMGWFDRHWWQVLVTVAFAAIACAAAISLTAPPIRAPFTNDDLAHVLGDTDNLFGPSVTCKTQRGRIYAATYNRRCLRVDLGGFCYPGTGETRTAVFVRVHARRYHIVDERVLWVAPPCDSVA
jgi:hypothetical protein